MYVRMYVCAYSIYVSTYVHVQCVLRLKLILLHLKVVGVAELPQYPPRGFVSPSLDEELVEEEETWQRGRVRERWSEV